MKASDEARAIAYHIGFSALAPLVDRVIKLEGLVEALTARIEDLAKEVDKSTPAHLHGREMRRA